MQLVNYINDLMYRYDCVIVPNFGGFVASKVGATIDHRKNVFYPPTKKISFNQSLKHNDGLLANYIASAERISYEKAIDVISTTVDQWKQQLKKSSVEIAAVGSLYLNEEQKITFQPNIQSNFLVSSFGLASITNEQIIRNQPKVKPMYAKTTVFKYAASAAVLVLLSALGYNYVNQNPNNLFTTSKKNEAVFPRVQEAKFVIDDISMPTIDLSAKTHTVRYHLVAGAFKDTVNAEKKLNQLKRKGFKDARIIGKNKWGLTQVTYGSYSSERNAINKLRSIQKHISKDAWLLTY